MTEPPRQRENEPTREMATRVRGFDWSATELGPVASWPASLATMVEVVLGHPYPMMLWWGARAIQIYNDAVVPLLGSRHPHGGADLAPCIGPALIGSCTERVHHLRNAVACSWSTTTRTPP